MAKTENNYTVINFEYFDKLGVPEFELCTPLQLLKMNTEQQHPFADRLIEYLIGNVITDDDLLSKNIKRVQKALEKATSTTNNHYHLYIDKKDISKYPDYPYTKDEHGDIIKIFAVDDLNEVPFVPGTITDISNRTKKIPVPTYRYHRGMPGIWDPEIKLLVYDYINTHYNTNFDVNHDILGYVDKDAEKYYQYVETTTKKNSISIANTEITEEDKL